jgi:hypothetical protein
MITGNQRISLQLTAIATVLALTASLLNSLPRLTTLPAERHIEMLVGAFLIWLPWVAAVPLVGWLLKRFPVPGKGSLQSTLVVHCFAAITVALMHMGYLRLIRPLPEMLFVGGSYARIYQRFGWGDYLLSLRVIENILIYAVIVLGWLLVRLRERRSSEQVAAASAAGASVAYDQPGTRGSDFAEPVITIRDGKSTTLLRPKEIDLIEACDYYVTIWSKGRRFLFRESLGTLETALTACGFVRTHRSFLVNVGQIRALTTCSGGDGVILLACGREIAVSRRRRKAVAAALRGLADLRQAN